MSTIEDLELQNDMGYTAFVIAAINGFKDMVEAMFIRDENLINIKEKHGLIPIVAASVACSTKVVRYLYPKTPDEMLSPEHPDRSGATLLNCLIVDDIYDLALHLLGRNPQLAFVEDLYGNYAIISLAQKTSAFPSGNNYVFWKQWIYSRIRVTPTLYGDEYSRSNDEESGIRILLEPNIQQVVLKKLRGLVWKLLTWIVPDISNIYKRKSNHIEAKKFLKSIINHIPRLSMEQLQKFGWDQAINDAIKNGISEFVDEVIESTPELIWKKDEKGRTIFANAIVQRQEDIFSRIYDLSANMHAIIQHDIFHNNFLHLAAKLSPPSRLSRISGAALQMQRELQWFEEMRSMLPPKYMEEVNESNKTPSELFTEKHQILVQEGERWMKNTAASCMVVATLIAAVMFTTAYTVPGGNNEKEGTPIFLKKDVFLIFVLSDALSLFSSCVSVLVFLGILTSRYAEKDFRKSLPTKLIIGLSSLFFSIVTMMASFGAAIVLILQDRLHWVSVPIIVLSSIPIALYSFFQFPLLIEVFFHTYGVSIFDNKRKRQYAQKLKDLTET
ncbi:uncharacterized protein LOC116122820 [Pistacia vera]|uniref:uncharacterized protein LOC116122820 n=1 Tax=Pistacia vera TaxID=55513 RepID=UPI001262D040|nr:uncharacterized protein LOC116122820 [Pistacia vera]